MHISGILDLHVQGTTTAYPCLGTGEYILTIEQIARTPPDAVVYVDAVCLHCQTLVTIVCSLSGSANLCCAFAVLKYTQNKKKISN